MIQTFPEAKRIPATTPLAFPFGRYPNNVGSAPPFYLVLPNPQEYDSVCPD